MPSIVTEIQVVEEEIKKCESRLDVIERSLRLSENMTEEERDSLIDEEKELQTKLKENEAKLRALRWENMKTMLVSVTFLLIGYLVYSMAKSS